MGSTRVSVTSPSEKQTDANACAYKYRMTAHVISKPWRPSTEPAIITCALTGGIHGKEANPNLPEQPDEIVEQGVAAWEAGAAVLHVHARDSDGGSTMDPDIYGEIHRRLCERTDAVIQLTTGGSPRLSIADRINTVYLSPEMCSLNLGILNFFIAGEQVFFPNHRDDIERFATEMAARDVRPEFEIYSSVMLEEAAHLLTLNILTPPYALNFVLNTPTQGGQRGTPQNLLDMAQRLSELPVEPADLRVTVSSMGATQLPITTMALAMGFNARLGLEDNLFFRRRELATSNAQLVERSVRIARELERDVATPDQARALLNLRGRRFGHLPDETPQLISAS